MISKNDLLVEITNKLASAEPEWAEIAARFRKTDMYRNKSYDFNNLVSHLAEIHLRVSLEKICGDFPGRAVFDPIKPGAETEEYLFSEINSHNLVIFKKQYADVAPAAPMNQITQQLVALNLLKAPKSCKNTLIYSEIDALILADSLPALFEIKISRSICSKGKVKDKSSSGINYAMKEDRVRELIDPIIKYLKSPGCGYVLMVPRNVVSAHSSNQNSLMQNGGIIVPFYTDRKTFRAEVGKVKEEQRL